MKTRLDFVSNSSSASFIIKNEKGHLKHFLQKLGEDFHNCDVPWRMEQWISCGFFTKLKDFNQVSRVFSEEKNPETLPYCQHLRDKKGDPEELYWDQIKVSIDTLKKVAVENPEVLDKVQELWLEAAEDNSEDCNRYLALLYKYARAINCHPDASDSERDFLNNHDPFVEKMTGIIKSKGIQL